MIKKLFDKFFKKSNNKSNNSSINNSILFFIDDNQDPYLKIFIHNTDAVSAKSFATMLKQINAGQHINNIITTLLSLSKEDANIYNFVQNVFSEWKNEYVDKPISAIDHNDEPIVKPTKFINSLKHE